MVCELLPRISFFIFYSRGSLFTTFFVHFQQKLLQLFSNVCWELGGSLNERRAKEKNRKKLFGSFGIECDGWRGRDQISRPIPWNGFRQYINSASFPFSRGGNKSKSLYGESKHNNGGPRNPLPQRVWWHFFHLFCGNYGVVKASR